MLKSGWPDAGWTLMERIVCYDPELNASRPFLEQVANGVLGLSKERIENIIDFAVHEWRHTTQGVCGCS
jgi:hypothetical protein